VSAVRDLARHGVSVWLDDLGRDRIDSGELRHLIDDVGIRGVTTNPSIFAAAVRKGSTYADRLVSLGAVSPEAALRQLMVDDVRDACDAFAGVFEESAGLDGRVSLEVDPRLAFDTEGTVAAARQAWSDVDRPNLLVKIPATREGLPAITAALGAGISVNVTLIFSVARYAEVQQAWLAGLEAADIAGHDLRRLASVASFFVSRLDTAVDGRLDRLAASGDIADETHRRLRGRAAVANARVAYRSFTELMAGSRWQSLAERGSLPQRPLWASTSTKDPTFPPTRYVDELVAPSTVNTLPAATLTAIQQGTTQQGTAERTPTIGLTSADADRDAQLFDDLGAVGIEYEDVVRELEQAGVASFSDAWGELLTLVETAQAAV
jgi:transaldolase